VIALQCYFLVGLNPNTSEIGLKTFYNGNLIVKFNSFNAITLLSIPQELKKYLRIKNPAYGIKCVFE